MYEVFRFECRYQLRSPLFLILALVFFLLAFAITGSESVRLGGVGNNTNLNAAWTIVYTQFFFSQIGMLAAIAIVAQAITRDYEIKTAEIIYASGIGERSFLLGRFAAGCLFGVLVGVAAILGTLLATLMPWLDQERVGVFDAAPYLYSLLVVTLPNFFVTSALFFTVAALARSMLAAFVAAVGFFVLNIVVGALTDPEQIQLLAVLDPFGGTAFGEVSRYWTVFERNVELVPIAGNLLANRLLWLAIGAAALAFTALRYRFSLNPNPFRRRRAARIVQTVAASAPLVLLPPPSLHISPMHQFLSQVRVDLGGVFKSVPFYAILGFGLLNVWGVAQGSTTGLGIPLFPTTSNMLRVIAGAYGIFIIMIIIYYSGELVHRERQTGVAEVVDAMPFANGIMVLSKLVTLWLLIFALYATGTLVCVGVQLWHGYTHLEPGLYLSGVFGIQAGAQLMIAVLAVFVQSISGNKWIGMTAMLALFLAFNAMGSFGFEHALYNFSPPAGSVIHSDMNGFGHFLTPYLALAGYWALFCVLLLTLAHLFFARGRPESIGRRFRAARQRLTTATMALNAAALLGFAGMGGWIFYNTNVLNDYLKVDDVDANRASYEKTYKHYELMNHLEPVDVSSEVDLFPEQRRLESRGRIVLRNVSTEPIDELFLSTHPRLQVNQLHVDGATLTEQDVEVGVHLFRFEPPVPPGSETRASFDVTWDHDGFENTNVNSTVGAYSRVVANGTFVNNTEIMPTIGYNSNLELTEPNKRREQGLAPIIRLPKIDDPAWINRSQLGFSQRTAFRTRFSTSADQIAVAPGYLVGEVEEREGRRIYNYQMDDKIWPFFSFSSARYAVARDTWNDVNIEVYHHPEHDYNIEPMIRGTQRSLDYFTREFSPYQYRQFRILEFPRYATFAQSFPNTIPFSESIGFVADLSDEHELDLVFYVTAHELAHQWWGHQVAGAQMQGMTVIVETLAQYSALMVMEAEYGKDKMRRFLRYELDQYLQQRGSELIEELPLVLCENQPYIHYRKGSLAMYALQDAIGADRVNLALRNFLAKYAFGTGPFPTARDLVGEFRAVAEPRDQAFIDDLFEKITVYDFGVDEVTATPVEDGWEVRFTTRAKKLYADGDGRETEAPLDLLVDIAVFPADPDDLAEYQLPEPLYFDKVRVAGNGEIVVKVAEQPHRVGIDPYNKLIDRNPEDNLKAI